MERIVGVEAGRGKLGQLIEEVVIMKRRRAPDIVDAEIEAARGIE